MHQALREALRSVACLGEVLRSEPVSGFVVVSKGEEAPGKRVKKLHEEASGEEASKGFEAFERL